MAKATFVVKVDGKTIKCRRFAGYLDGNTLQHGWKVTASRHPIEDSVKVHYVKDWKTFSFSYVPETKAKKAKKTK